MRRWLDRVWLAAIALAFLVMVPVWIALWYERHPLLGLIQLGLVGRLVWGWIHDGLTQRSPQTWP